MKSKFKKIFRLSALTLAALAASNVYASGYKLVFQSTSTLADGGDAAVVEDAGTNWYNAAGLVNLPRQFVVSGIAIYVPTTFAGTVTAPSTLPAPFNAVGGFDQGGRSTASTSAILPAIHASIPWNQCVSLGFSVVPAWGFAENYGGTALVRYVTNRIYTRSFDISPSMAMRWNEHFSFALGPDFHYFTVQSQSHVRTQGAPPVGTPNDSTARFTAQRWAYGGHAGILYQFNDCTRVGLAYRSRMLMRTEGYSSFSLDEGGFFEVDNFQLPVPLPAVTTLSAYHDVNPTWALMGTISFDQWSTLRTYHARNYAQPTGVIPDVVIPQYMRNAFNFSLGTHYRLNEQLLLRGSVRLVETPTKSAYRNVNFPDGAKLGLQVGSRYQVTKAMALDLLYGHVFVRTAHINDVNPVSNAVARGRSKSSIDMLGAQLVWNV